MSEYNKVRDLILSLSLNLSLSLSLTHTHTQTLSLSLTLSLTHSLSLYRIAFRKSLCPCCVEHMPAGHVWERWLYVSVLGWVVRREGEREGESEGRERRVPASEYVRARVPACARTLVCVRVRVFACVCVRACQPACVRACVRACT